MAQEMKALHRRIAIGGVILLLAGIVWYVGISFFVYPSTR